MKFRLTDMSYFSSRHGVPGALRHFILTDGWDGMGWGGRATFFFWPISRKLLDIFFKLVRILLEHVSRYFFRETQKDFKKLHFSKIFAKIGGWFFFHFFKH